MRPLDRLSSIKVKLGVVIVATVAGTVIVLAIGFRLGWSLELRTLVAAVIGLALVQLLARGMTSPLREMAAAASAMARGDYGRRVTASSRDEVGELARAFNAMAAELADVDRMRRDLVANVSHELRTPIGALQALLENLIDGVEPVDPAACRRRWCRPSGSDGWCRSCSTSRGSRAARWRCGRRRSRSARCSSRRRASAPWRRRTPCGCACPSSPATCARSATPSACTR